MPPDDGGNWMIVAAKLAAGTALLTGVWEQMGARAAAIIAVATILGWLYRRVIRPIIRTIDHAGDVYHSVTGLEGRVDAKIADVRDDITELGTDLGGKVERLAGNAQKREDELDRRLVAVEASVDTVRTILGTRRGDHPPTDGDAPLSSG